MTSSRGAGSRMWLRVISLLLIACGALIATSPATSQQRRIAVVLDIDGAIGPATSNYFQRGLTEAQERGAALVVLRLDTPGGLDTSMRQMIRAIIASPVPVATYVAPGGARAASAGAYILYASHIAAMAPGTNVGAATPIQLGGAPGIDDQKPAPAPGAPDKDEAAGKASRPANASEAKAVNDAVAYIRALARLRGRNPDWAESAVREAASLEADQALAAKVIDFMAADVADVLAKADGRQVRVGASMVTLQTRSLSIEEVKPGWRYRLLAAITNPNVALILLMLGVYGIIFEFMNPGVTYPGVIGAISLLLGLYGIAVLPVNYAGLMLIIVGIGLMVAEGFATSFGVLGLGGATAFILGGMLLIDSDTPGLEVSLPLLAGLAVAGLAFSLLVLRLAFNARRSRVVSGREQMIGSLGVVQDWGAEGGFVFIHGERWRAVSDAPLKSGDRVRAVALENLTLTVIPQDRREP